jgi:hypothetical protein
MIAGKLYDVGVGPHGHITGEGEFRNENAEGDLFLAIDVRDRVYEEVVPANFDLVSSISQLFEIGATTYQLM